MTAGARFLTDSTNADRPVWIIKAVFDLAVVPALGGMSSAARGPANGQLLRSHLRECFVENAICQITFLLLDGERRRSRLPEHDPKPEAPDPACRSAHALMGARSCVDFGPVRDAVRSARDGGKAVSHCEMNVRKEDNPADWHCQGESFEFAQFLAGSIISHSEIPKDHLDILSPVGYTFSTRFHDMKHLSLQARRWENPSR